MTLIEDNDLGTAAPETGPRKGAAVRPRGQVRLAEQVRVAVIFSGRQHDLTLPATVPVATVVAGILNTICDPADSLLEAGEDGRITPGAVVLRRVNGQALDREEDLQAQGVIDGDLLRLEVGDAEVTLTPIIENASSATAQILSNHRQQIDEAVTFRFAAITAALGVVLTVGLLLNAWRINLAAGHDVNLMLAGAAAVLTAALLATATIVWWRHRELTVATSLWLSALVSAPAAAVIGTPGQPSAWHAVFGFATVTVVASALWALTPAPRGVLAWTAITGGCWALISALHALGVQWGYLWVAVMAIALLVLKLSEGIAGRLARLPMPEFPTVTGKNVFDPADDIAAQALEAAATHGTPSMAQLTRAAIAANTYLTVVIACTAVFFVVGSASTITPGQGRWWLATVYVLMLATILVLAARAFADRVQAIILVATGLIMMAAVGLTYVRANGSGPGWSVAIAAAVLLLGVGALVIAAVVPKHVFSPLFRKLVEWLEYALIALVPPLCWWLLNLYYLARNR